MNEIDKWFNEPIPDHINKLVDYQDAILKASWIDDAIRISGEMGDNELFEFREDYLT